MIAKAIAERAAKWTRKVVSRHQEEEEEEEQEERHRRQEIIGAVSFIPIDMDFND